MKKILFCATFLVVSLACSQSKKSVDLLITNANIYSVDSSFTQFEAMAVHDGKIVDKGSTLEIQQKYQSIQVEDMDGLPVFPGFYDAHSHFVGLGETLSQCDLVGTSSLAEILERLQKYRKENPSVSWIVGRGWDQNDWVLSDFPHKKDLDKLFPDIPVFLTRVDGHAAFCNSKALKVSKISETTAVDGGEFLKDKKGKLTGILIDNAMGMVRRVMPRASEEEKKAMILKAQKACLALGLTTVSDAGLHQKDIELLHLMHKEGLLKIRDYAMVSLGLRNLDHFISKGILKTDRLHVRSFKLYADGALGSRGACLIQPYTDRPSTNGFLLLSEKELRRSLQQIAASDYQANTHCIGDSANRLILNIYGELLGKKNDRRWRIEHAQIVHKNDIDKFGEFSVIPSVQGTHATSDMYWAENRLGKERIATAYAFKDLMEQNGFILQGSDFPVEAVNPLYGFHALIARQDAENSPQEGFQMENALSRQEAIRAMTIWSAYGNFEDKERGSLEVGKLADFVVLEKDIMTSPASEIRNTQVKATYIGGEKVYSQP